ncbi:MAG: hypothetical protein Q7T53_13450 [Deltaproteobacteria bacterium]|nr:hypothetical protein [Deltaproteobacteria bacterium]
MEQLFSKFNADIQDVLTPPDDNSFPSSRTPDPEHRKEKARDHATKADDKVYEERMRTVSTSANANNPEAKEYLRNEYRTDDGSIICQLCHEKMPFQLNGIDYFERQPFIDNLSKEHRANNLALCPNCAAEFQHTCNTDEGEKKGLILDLDDRLPDDELWIELDMPVHKELRFTQRHLIDLKGALDALYVNEDAESEGEEQEDSENDEWEKEAEEIENDVESESLPTVVPQGTRRQVTLPSRPQRNISRCRFCGSPAMIGSDVCYSCGS